MNKKEMIAQLEKGVSPLLVTWRKWRDIAMKIGKDESGRNCACCYKYYDMDVDWKRRCDRCPIKEYTKKAHCEGTPYDEYRLAVQRFGRKSKEANYVAKEMCKLINRIMYITQCKDENDKRLKNQWRVTPTKYAPYELRGMSRHNVIFASTPLFPNDLLDFYEDPLDKYITVTADLANWHITHTAKFEYTKIHNQVWDSGELDVSDEHDELRKQIKRTITKDVLTSITQDKRQRIGITRIVVEADMPENTIIVDPETYANLLKKVDDTQTIETVIMQASQRVSKRARITSPKDTISFVCDNCNTFNKVDVIVSIEAPDIATPLKNIYERLKELEYDTCDCQNCRINRRDKIKRLIQKFEETMKELE